MPKSIQFIWLNILLFFWSYRVTTAWKSRNANLAIVRYRKLQDICSHGRAVGKANGNQRTVDYFEIFFEHNMTALVSWFIDAINEGKLGDRPDVYDRITEILGHDRLTVAHVCNFRLNDKPTTFQIHDVLIDYLSKKIDGKEAVSILDECLKRIRGLEKLGEKFRAREPTD